jgi:hypothetical protein
MTEALVPYTAAQPLDLMTLGKMLAQSGYFSESREASQAIVKVLAGQEMGIGPIASMSGIHIIKGKPSIGSNLMAACVRRSRRYDYRVRKLDNNECDLEFFERDGDKMVSLGHSTFTIEDAKKASTQNTDKFARNMLFARSMSNGVKWYCPDVFITPIYTPDELGARVDYETGEVIDSVPTSPAATTPAPEPSPTKTNGNGALKPDRRNREPLDLVRLRAAMDQKIATYSNTAGYTDLCTAGMRGLLVGKLNEVWAGDPDPHHSDAGRHMVVEFFTGQSSSKLLTKAQAQSMLDWLLDPPDSTNDYPINGAARQEIQAIESRAQEAAGQQPLPL